jgi:hypothetical protein
MAWPQFDLKLELKKQGALTKVPFSGIVCLQIVAALNPDFSGCRVLAHIQD